MFSGSYVLNSNRIHSGPSFRIFTDTLREKSIRPNFTHRLLFLTQLNGSLRLTKTLQMYLKIVGFAVKYYQPASFVSVIVTIFILLAVSVQVQFSYSKANRGVAYNLFLQEFQADFYAADSQQINEECTYFRNTEEQYFSNFLDYQTQIKKNPQVFSFKVSIFQAAWKFPDSTFFRGNWELILHESNFYKLLCFGCKVFVFSFCFYLALKRI